MQCIITCYSTDLHNLRYRSKIIRNFVKITQNQCNHKSIVICSGFLSQNLVILWHISNTSARLKSFTVVHVLVNYAPLNWLKFRPFRPKINLIWLHHKDVFQKSNSSYFRRLRNTTKTIFHFKRLQTWSMKKQTFVFYSCSYW